MVDPMVQPREGDTPLGLLARGAGQSAERAAADQAVTSTATPSGASSSDTSQLPSLPSSEDSHARICRSKARSGAVTAELTGPRKVRSLSSPPAKRSTTRQRERR